MTRSDKCPMKCKSPPRSTGPGGNAGGLTCPRGRADLEIKAAPTCPCRNLHQRGVDSVSKPLGDQPGHGWLPQGLWRRWRQYLLLLGPGFRRAGPYLRKGNVGVQMLRCPPTLAFHLLLAPLLLPGCCCCRRRLPVCAWAGRRAYARPCPCQMHRQARSTYPAAARRGGWHTTLNPRHRWHRCGGRRTLHPNLSRWEQQNGCLEGERLGRGAQGSLC